MRRPLTLILTAALLVVSAFAAWMWFRPYEWNADPGARFHIQQARVSRDHGYVWMDLYLQRSGQEPHELEKPILLQDANGRTFEPAETTLSSREGGGTTGIWLRFWLEAADLNPPLTLRLNEGALSVKSTTGTPDLGSDGKRMFLSNHW